MPAERRQSYHIVSNSKTSYQSLFVSGLRYKVKLPVASRSAVFLVIRSLHGSHMNVCIGLFLNFFAREHSFSITSIVSHNTHFTRIVFHLFQTVYHKENGNLNEGKTV